MKKALYKLLLFIEVHLEDHLFLLLIGCPTVNFGSISRRQSHSPDVNHCVLSIFDPKVTGSVVAWLDP